MLKINQMHQVFTIAEIVFECEVGDVGCQKVFILTWRSF